MSDPFVGEIRMFGGNFPPQGWLFCQGQTLAISDYGTLFALIGTTYGGDGQTTFNLPNLASRVPVHAGTLSGTSYPLGATGGTEAVTLTTQQLPVHTHPVTAAGVTGNAAAPSASAVLSDMGPSGTTSPPVYGPYSAGSTVTLNGQTVQPVGGSGSHSNIQPYLAINFIISLYGIYPSQN